MNKQSTDMLKAIKEIKRDMQSLSERIGETEGQIPQAEDDVTSLQNKVKTLEKTVKVLYDRVTEHEDRSRHSNLRLVGYLRDLRDRICVVFWRRGSERHWVKVSPHPSLWRELIGSDPLGLNLQSQ